MSDAAEGELQRRLGVNIRLIREERGVSQEAFAEQLGFHRTYVGGLERGERNLSLKAIERLANQLDVDPLALLASSPNSRLGVTNAEHRR